MVILMGIPLLLSRPTQFLYHHVRWFDDILIPQLPPFKGVLGFGDLAIIQPVSWNCHILGLHCSLRWLPARHKHLDRIA
jgi:hypothetical protein